MAKLNGKSILAVGNFDSNVGYAWRLMELFWCELAVLGRRYGYSTIVCFPTISVVPRRLSDSGCRVEKIDFSKSDFGSVIKQLGFLRRHSIKLIYFTDFKTFSFRYLLFRLVGVSKIIIHDHTPGVRHRPKALKRLLKGGINRTPLISCSAAFAVSPYVSNRLVTSNIFPAKKVYCITNGIAVNEHFCERCFIKNCDRLRIVTVGRVCYYKGIDFALEVIKSLVEEEGFSIEYLIIGDGPDRYEFELEVKRKRLNKHVFFAGNVDDVTERLLEFDVAFHPSKGEAMSLAILEYMRAGLAIVASDNPSVSSTLIPGETALIYKEGDVKSAVSALREVLKSRGLRVDMGKRAQKIVKEQFSEELMISRFNNAVKDIIS